MMPFLAELLRNSFHTSTYGSRADLDAMLNDFALWMRLDHEYLFRLFVHGHPQPDPAMLITLTHDASAYLKEAAA